MIDLQQWKHDISVARELDAAPMIGGLITEIVDEIERLRKIEALAFATETIYWSDNFEQQICATCEQVIYDAGGGYPSSNEHQSDCSYAQLQALRPKEDE